MKNLEELKKYLLKEKEYLEKRLDEMDDERAYRFIFREGRLQEVNDILAKIDSNC